jgi:hypothetical protein
VVCEVCVCVCARCVYECVCPWGGGGCWEACLGVGTHTLPAGCVGEFGLRQGSVGPHDLA